MVWDIGICAILLRWKRRSVYFSNANHGLTRVSGSMRSRHDRVVCYEPSSCEESIYLVEDRAAWVSSTAAATGPPTTPPTS
jgi:hypothetical protein